jgi:hypothetical protein
VIAPPPVFLSANAAPMASPMQPPTIAEVVSR